MAENRQPSPKRSKRKGKKIEYVILCACIVLALIAGFMLGRMSTIPDEQNGITTTASPATESVTPTPADTPTDAPAETPADTPTDAPADTPTDAPADAPTDAPTDAPAETPADTPTDAPQSTDLPAVPANPMEQAGTSDESEAKIITYRPLRNAEKIRIAMKQRELPLIGARIGIDPGHQIKGNSSKEPVAPGSSEMKAKVSSGTQGVATRVPEYVVNLDVSLQLRDALEALGAEVYLTRDTNEIDISNVERATMMNELEVDMVLRIHCNGSENQSTKGISLFVKSKGAGAEESYAICEALLPAMVDATGARSIGIFKRDTYSGMNWSTVPSILVEMGFMSNPEEDRLLNDPVYQHKLVDGMVQGIADYMGRDLSVPDEKAVGE